MRKDRSLLLANAGANIFGLGLPAVAALVVIPTLVHKLGITTFGYFSIQLAILYFLGVADFGIARTIVLSTVRNVGRTQWEQPFQVGMLYTVLLSTFVMALSVPVGALTWHFNIGGVQAADVAVSTSLTMISAALTLLSLPSRAVLEIQNRFPTMNLIRGFSAAGLFLGPLYVMQFSTQLTTIAATIVAVRLAALVAFVWFSGTWSALRFQMGRRQRQHRPEALKYKQDFRRRLGWIGLTNTISPLLGYLDRFFIGALTSAAAVGQYALAHELTTKISLLVGAATSASLPRLVSERLDGDSKRFQRLVRTTTSLVVVLGCLPSFGLIVFAEDILSIWIRDSYSSSVLPMQILAIGIGINSLSQVNFMLLQLAGGERAGAVLQLVQIPIVTVLLLILVPGYGLVGAAIAISTRLFFDGLILRWMLIKQYRNQTVPGITAAHIAIAALVGVFLSIHAG